MEELNLLCADPSSDRGTASTALRQYRDLIKQYTELGKLPESARQKSTAAAAGARGGAGRSRGRGRSSPSQPIEVTRGSADRGVSPPIPEAPQSPVSFGSGGKRCRALFAYDGRLAAELMAENASERALEAGGSAVGPDLCRFLDGIDEIAVRRAPTPVDIAAAAGGGGDRGECCC